MGIFILIVFFLIGVCFFNSKTFKRWTYEQEKQEEEQRRKIGEENLARMKEDARQALYDQACEFYSTIKSNDAVKTFANGLLDALRNMMENEICRAQSNLRYFEIVLGVRRYGIRKLKNVYGSYMDDLDDKSGLSLSFADYGIEMHEDFQKPYKEYGLALLLESFITSQSKTFPQEVKKFKIHAECAQESLSRFEIRLLISWTIGLNKFVEL